MARVTINREEFVRDIRAGMAESELCQKFGLSPAGLEYLFAKLIESGAVNREDLPGHRAQSSHQKTEFACPACGRTHPTQFQECPNCGVIVAKVLRQQEKKRAAGELNYTLHGDATQFVEIALNPGGAVVAEAGALMYLGPGIQMETLFGDASEESQKKGLLGKVADAGKRVLTGETLFTTLFTNRGLSLSHAAFASPYPGTIVPLTLGDCGGELICQKGAFLCGAQGVVLDIALQKKIGTGLFGGEGFILQRLRGEGLVFVHAGGTVAEKLLGVDDQIRVDTGCVVAFERTVEYEIQRAGGIKTSLFGGEGVFLTTLRGPGRTWLQSLPFSRLAGRVYAAAPQVAGARKVGEGSLLGGIADMVSGD